MKFLVILITLFFPFCSFAEAIYEQSNPNGSITYSDTPLKNSQVIQIPENTSTPQNNTASMLPSATSSNSHSALQIANGPHMPYTSFIMTSPTDQQTFQNQRLIPVLFNLKPSLQQGDKIQLLLDGSLYGTPIPSTQLALGELQRGTHTVAAEILDKDNTILNRTNPVTIFIHYANLGTNPNPSVIK